MKNTEKWPNFIVVGVEKAGSTSIWNNLMNTDDVFMVKNKAPGFFHGEKYGKTCNEKEYLNLFEDASNEMAIGEATASYFIDEETPELIYKKIPNVKIIILLRDPIERAFSHYLMYKSKQLEEKTFNKIVVEKLEGSNEKNVNLFLNSSLYYENVKRFIEKFGSNNVKIIIFEEFVEKPEKVFREILNFLGIKSKLPNTLNQKLGEYTEGKSLAANTILKNKLLIKTARIFPKNFRSKIKKDYLINKKPEVDSDSREKLGEFYRDDIKKLEILLSRKFSWNVKGQI